MSGELPQTVIRRAHSGAAVLSRRYNVNVVVTRLANEPFIGNAVQRHTARITEITAATQFAETLDQVEQSDFERRLHRTSERFVLRRVLGPAPSVTEL